MFDFVTVLQALFLFLPAYLGNMMAVIFPKLGLFKSLDFPVDMGRKLRGEYLFGEHKTWRGVVAGIIGGIVAALLQYLLYTFFVQSRWIFLFPLDLPASLWWGFLLGLGALLGDLIKSFFKRRLHIKSGGIFFPFDQLDFIFGALLLGLLYYRPPWQHILVVILFTPLFHFFVNVIAYKLRLKKVWW
jgi:CDP-2,3-bis-(O-geranylgeranyl)-sn-glycerol synthase